MRQTIKADRTILWVAHADMALLPPDVISLQSAGLEIRGTGEMRSYKKIIPALDVFPDAFICTADDDLYYWPTWLEELIEAVDLADPTVTCHRAHEITFDPRGEINAYAQWVQDTPIRGISRHLFPTGCMGVLYPPGTLTHDADDRAAAFEHCPNADDIWLYWIARRNGALHKCAGQHRRPLILWPGYSRCCFVCWQCSSRKRPANPQHRGQVRQSVAA